MVWCDAAVVVLVTLARYYIVVSLRRSTTYSVIAIVLALAASTTLGQQPVPSGPQSKQKPQPIGASLMPLEQAWLVTLPAVPFAAGAMDADQIYVPTRDDNTIALARETGEKRWVVEIESQWPPVARDGVLFLAANDELHALDAADGKTIWRTLIAGGPSAPFTLAGDTIVIPTGMGSALGIRAASGEIAWTHPLGVTPLHAGVADATGTVYYALPEGRLLALATADGRVMWEQKLPGTLSEPAVARERVFVGSTDNKLYALHAATGAPAWTWTAGGDVIGAVADNELVYVAVLDNIFRALNRGNGNQRWRQPVAARPVAPPRVGSGVVWVSGLQSIAAFLASSGMPLGTLEAPSEIEGQPLIDPALQPFRVAGAIVTRDGKVMGIRPVAMMFREGPLAPLLQLPGKALQRERLPQP